MAAVSGLCAVDAFAQPAPQPKTQVEIEPGAPDTPATPDPSNLGGIGESCRARVDCQTGLKCVDQVCTDASYGESCGATSECSGGLRCIGQVCSRAATAPVPVPAPLPGAPAPDAPVTAEPVGPEGALPDAPPPPSDYGRGDSWSDHDIFDGIHGFAGVGFKPGVGLALDYASGNTTDPEFAFMFSLRGGVLFGRTELAVEFAPATARPFWPFPDPSLSLVFSVGHHLHLAGPVNWPLRFGVGMMAVNTPGDVVLFQTRADLLGLSFNVGHLLIDLYLPSFRYLTDFDLGGVFNWYFGSDIVYAF